MKLRIRGNSIRLRLTRSDVAELAERGSIEEAVEFGAGKPHLKYRIDTVSDADVIQAAFHEGQIRVIIPENESKNWVYSEQVGLEAIQPIDDERSLRILIEKDFACLTERAYEDETDAFPNPAGGAC